MAPDQTDRPATPPEGPAPALPIAGILDAHQHFWDPQANYHPWLCDAEAIPFRYGDYSPLRRPYLPPEYRAAMGRLPLLGSVYVETEWDPADPLGESRWVSALAAREGLPSAVVAQAWLNHEDVADVLAGQAAFPLVRGIRHKPAAAGSPQAARSGAPGSMDDPRWRDGYALLERHGFSFDLQTPWWHLDAAARLAGDFPRVPLILNHTGLPALRDPENLGRWRQALEGLARQPNTAIKISGLGLANQPWRVEANGPLIRDAITIFGVERAMFASNFPVDSLVVENLETLWRNFLGIVADYAPADQAALFGGNAARWYRIAP